MKVIVSNDITIYDPTPQLYHWVEERLILNNPDYFKKERMNKWLGNTPQKIYLYESYPDRIVIPFGCLRSLWADFYSKATFETNLHTPIKKEYKSDIKPYPYQEKAIQAILHLKNGVLVMPCGSGKTVCGLEIISRIGNRALWLTHTTDLLNQSKDRATSLLDIGVGTYGTITSGKVKVGSHITFATVQTMANIDLSKLKNEFDVVIVDECAHCAGSPTKITQFYKVVSALNSRYKIGLTATPKRSDGLEQSMFAILGGVVCEIDKEEVAHTTCPLHVKLIETGYFPTDDIFNEDGTINYTAITDDLIHDKAREDIIVETLNNLDGSAIVLANRIEYLERLQSQFDGKSVCLSTLGYSKKAKEERKTALAKLGTGELDAVFASYKLASEGLDVPSLRYVVFATPEKFETTVIQSAGRVMRKYDGKPYGTVIDFCDDFGMYRSWERERKKFYKKLNGIIE